MRILEAIIRAASTYETETGSKLKGIALNLQDFEDLLEDLREGNVAFDSNCDDDPFCGITVYGMKIDWHDWDEEDEQRKLKAGIEEDHEEERAARDFLPNDEHEKNREAAKKLGEKLVEGFASSMDDIFKDALKRIKK